METLSIVVMNWRDLKNPAAGGAEVFTQEVLERWASWGHNVTLITSRFPTGPSEETVGGVQVLRVGDRLSVYRDAHKTYQNHFRSKEVTLIDEINTRPFLTPRYVGSRTRVFALIHQLAREFWSYETPFPVSFVGRYWLEDHWLRTYRDIPTVCPSDSTKQDLISLGFQDVTVVLNGLSQPPLATIPEKETNPTLVYVNRLRRAKLPDHAVDAFSRVHDRLPKSRLWVVGDGYLRRHLEGRALDGVRFWGRVSDALKMQLLTRAHLLLYPAVREGWGLTVIEANAVGTPAIGYNVPGLRDSIRDGETGVLVPAGDVSSLAGRAIELLADNPSREAMALRGLRWAGQFSWDRTAREFMARLGGRIGVQGGAA